MSDLLFPFELTFAFAVFSVSRTSLAVYILLPHRSSVLAYGLLLHVSPLLLLPVLRAC